MENDGMIEHSHWERISFVFGLCNQLSCNERDLWILTNVLVVVVNNILQENRILLFHLITDGSHCFNYTML